VFPDGWKGFWHQLRPPDRQSNLDDARFLAELSVHLEGQVVARSWPVYLAGISNGARFAEHVARHGQAQRVADAAAFSSAGSGSQPACDQTTFPAAETSTSHGWSCTP
jgi:poly(3-hydroxybutyrate) depolymerase